MSEHIQLNFNNEKNLIRKQNLDFLLRFPDFSSRAKLTIDALAPLSMVASLPGKYYHSQTEPTDFMLYGMFENALGWHVSTKERNELGKKLKKIFGEPEKTGVGFISLLQFHRLELKLNMAIHHRRRDLIIPFN